jgi:5-methylcytosine-specific restriction endonuclease McrBC GTP-binding regulatory subunit McrB
MSNKPIQKILFGSPGTGKSYRVKNEIIPNQLNITAQSNIITTVFHPEYTYGDFMGKLMPLTDDKQKVSYSYYTGHFLKALGRAYKNIISAHQNYDSAKEKKKEEYRQKLRDAGELASGAKLSSSQTEQLNRLYDSVEKPIAENVVLVIDELNRGNSAAIFGTVFQLLDRAKDGWSEYPITISGLETIGLLKEVGLSTFHTTDSSDKKYRFKGQECSKKEYEEVVELIFENLEENKKVNLLYLNKIKLPPNLSILATMNTSDNSIYFMDSAFKRRWDWEFVNIEDDGQRNVVSGRKIKLYNNDTCAWNDFVDKLNGFIRSRHDKVRKIEDKQIGYFFINEETITEEHIKNKLMFFIWDSVFSNNREPLTTLLEMKERDLVTFGQFTQKDIVQKFVNKIMGFGNV